MLLPMLPGVSNNGGCCTDETPEIAISLPELDSFVAAEQSTEKFAGSAIVNRFVPVQSQLQFSVDRQTTNLRVGRSNRSGRAST
jgi:hypothetical protein